MIEESYQNISQYSVSILDLFQAQQSKPEQQEIRSIMFCIVNHSITSFGFHIQTTNGLYTKIRLFRAQKVMKINIYKSYLICIESLIIETKYCKKYFIRRHKIIKESYQSMQAFSKNEYFIFIRVIQSYLNTTVKRKDDIMFYYN